MQGQAKLLFYIYIIYKYKIITLFIFELCRKENYIQLFFVWAHEIILVIIVLIYYTIRKYIYIFSLMINKYVIITNALILMSINFYFLLYIHFLKSVGRYFSLYSFFILLLYILMWRFIKGYVIEGLDLDLRLLERKIKSVKTFSGNAAMSLYWKICCSVTHRWVWIGNFLGQ